MLYISRKSAHRAALKALQKGIGAKFEVRFTKRREKDSLWTEVGYQAAIFDAAGRFLCLA